jgi:guanylate kinase
MLLILTGKTASGKDTIKDALLQRYPGFRKVMTSTSRAPRNREIDGAEYNFLSRENFLKEVSEGKFLEYVEYGGNLYGTKRAELENNLQQDVLWRIDPSRAGEAREFIKRAFPEEISKELIRKLIVIYITAPDEVILERLQRRNLPEEEIRKRMDDDKKIWEQYKDSYDFVVENTPNKLGECLESIIRLIENHAQ